MAGIKHKKRLYGSCGFWLFWKGSKISDGVVMQLTTYLYYFFQFILKQG